MTVVVSRLQIAEDVHIRTEALSLLYTDTSDDDTHDVIECAVVEVAESMGKIEQALMDGDLGKLCETASTLTKLGDRIGFMLLSRVAQDAINCARRKDMNALHAVSDRLIRVGDASLAAAIDGVTLPAG